MVLIFPSVASQGNRPIPNTFESSQHLERVGIGEVGEYGGGDRAERGQTAAGDQDGLRRLLRRLVRDLHLRFDRPHVALPVLVDAHAALDRRGDVVFGLHDDRRGSARTARDTERRCESLRNGNKDDE